MFARLSAKTLRAGMKKENNTNTTLTRGGSMDEDTGPLTLYRLGRGRDASFFAKGVARREQQ